MATKPFSQQSNYVRINRLEMRGYRCFICIDVCHIPSRSLTEHVFVYIILPFSSVVNGKMHNSAVVLIIFEIRFLSNSVRMRSGILCILQSFFMYFFVQMIYSSPFNIRYTVLSILSL